MVKYHKLQLLSISCTGTGRYVVDTAYYENLPLRRELHDLLSKHS